MIIYQQILKRSTQMLECLIPKSPDLTRSNLMLPRLVLALSALSLGCAAVSADAGGFTLAQELSYPYPQELVAAPKGSELAWVQDEGGCAMSGWWGGRGLPPGK